MDCACTAFKKSARMHGALQANTTVFLGEALGLFNEDYSRELADIRLCRISKKGG